MGYVDDAMKILLLKEKDVEWNGELNINNVRIIADAIKNSEVSAKDYYKCYKIDGAMLEDIIGLLAFGNSYDFMWELLSWAVAEYCPEYLDPDKYNWDRDSDSVAEFCPEHLDPDKYNWNDYSHVVQKYCPEKMALRPKNK